MNLGNLPAAIFSPVKMVYIGYILLASLKLIDTSLTQFLVISVVFVVVQVFHDDFLRIRLNYLGVPKEHRNPAGQRR